MTVPHQISAPDGCVLVTEVSGHGSVALGVEDIEDIEDDEAKAGSAGAAGGPA
ncbi:hypothetical protein [Pseudofrankia asymbiotica]|uniref:hypothetical protein n=1 Tax=Pseudofrankia asymbiotica TaxID=1834516 RepID=UPI00130465B8|nr:hypothetical protein [Pseudofrankia asymbiotica]